MKLKAGILIGLMVLVGANLGFAKSSLWIAVTDLYDQKSIKPQEAGSMTQFTVGTVTTDGKLFESTEQNFDWITNEMDPALTTRNPVAASPESLANGENKFYTYCAVCHTDNSQTSPAGLANSKVNEKGMLAPAMLLMTPGFSDGYIYSKIKYGGAIMPVLGYATTDKDRWDIVNFIRAKLETQP
ncbi:MAG: hypothetical protein A2508_09785 [Candidatus Lambdaproteobacteria bacterium RIFOXYD12_FULL_49_8]|uniref:Cytochrome c domain-containing protein n=1 Tax=Candidatus Lambdaproteobacteria bacterium RIFOXYD2_FULL_50_16 TaxID=1817772 RepID=A0A1F6G632_9PROT|nr:MAG: hypothetical protein A2527_11620 [Candidatus Lambdaproteobacteria bacterium RIFOXYD2_FULL_50_16]OGG97609.1 MAG: hypothetical protein A2508_09785 [Candidatus Lambdaproteobacteria bacterium RIFOXYD12_FULL_49_8]